MTFPIHLFETTSRGTLRHSQLPEQMYDALEEWNAQGSLQVTSLSFALFDFFVCAGNILLLLVLKHIYDTYDCHQGERRFPHRSCCEVHSFE